MHATGVKKPLAKLLFLIGTATPCDIGQLIYDQIVGNAEFLTTHPILPFFSLIFGILLKQQDVMKKDAMSKNSSGVIRISKKLHSGKHVDDVQGESSSEEEDDIPESVA